MIDVQNENIMRYFLLVVLFGLFSCDYMMIFFQRYISIVVEADSQSGPYKAVPAPKPLANPPPYRQPPPPANSSSPELPAARPHLHHNDPSVVASAAAATAAASTATSSESNPKIAGHGLLAHSSKFPVRFFCFPVRISSSSCYNKTKQSRIDYIGSTTMSSWTRAGYTITREKNIKGARLFWPLYLLKTSYRFSTTALNLVRCVFTKLRAN